MIRMGSSASDSQIRDYARRPKLYENIDGTAELFFAALYLGGGWLGSELESLIPADSFWGKGHPGHFVVLIWAALIFGAAYYGTRLIKRRVTYPRTGYVAQRQGGKSNRLLAGLISAVLGAAVSGTLAVLMRGHHVDGSRFLIVAISVLPYAVFAIIACRGETWKWVLAAGLALYLTNIALVSRGPLLHKAVLATGLVWLLSGAVTLLLYIRRTHPPAQEAE
jgi:hypothetical protein